MNAERPPAKLGGLLTKLISGYRTFAVLLLSTILIFVLLNVAAYVASAIRDQVFSVAGPSTVYPEKELAAIYPEYTKQEWKLMMHECWSRPYVYADYVLYKEQPCQGKYVNVTELGFRKVKNQGPWPPQPGNINIFLFGGSTLFGYGVEDGQTVASHLQAALAPHARKRLCVYNFGASSYYSTQERILFERLLTQGFRPDAAVFVDGLNDFTHVYDCPDFNDKVELLAFGGNLTPYLMRRLPINGILSKVRLETRTIVSADGEHLAQPLLQRYQSNKKLIEAVCGAFGVIPVFVWQPIPSYKYDTSYHRFYAAPKNYVIHNYGYAALEPIARQGALGPNFLWCADLQQDAKEALYVDIHHYTGKFSKRLAEAIVRMILEREILKPVGLELAPAAAR
jgi:hypothetical protein